MTNVKRFTSHVLASVEKPRFIYEYYVTGPGQFPFDMLRYDAAWPADSEAAAQMDRQPFTGNSMRSIRIRSYREPTIDRWSSFLWSVGTEKLR